MLTLNQIDNKTVVTVPEQLIGLRLDTALAIIITDISRNRLQSWIKDKKIKVDEEEVTANYRVKSGEKISFYNINNSSAINILNTNNISIDELQQFNGADIHIDVVYEDDDIIVVNKQAGLIVHPGANNHENTLMNALLAKYKELYEVPRAGIVHRIDKDTSGLLVVARNLSAHIKLVQHISNKSMKRIYNTLVYGHVPHTGEINAKIIRDKNHRTRMMVSSIGGRDAITRYNAIEYLPCVSLVECCLETGRTHQIRVHMQHIGYPILGDQVYGQNKINSLVHQLKIDKSDLTNPVVSLNRQALHAKQLSLIHPKTGEELTFHSQLPEDIINVIDYLRECS